MNAPRAYYNEHDPFAAAWLRNLVQAGHIAPGDVDERDIRDVRPADLDGYAQCHFFAGIGVWSYALRLAGWPDERPVWSASCPCQPLSSAGLGLGHADERHLWPALHGLVAERRPAALFGEQVASRDGREWFAAVRADLEQLGYACGAADLPAAGVGAPHIRHRLWFVADADGERAGGVAETLRSWQPEHGRDGCPRSLANAAGSRPQGSGPGRGPRPGREGSAAERSGAARGLGDTDRGRCGRIENGEGRLDHGPTAGREQDDGRPQHAGPSRSFWSECDWLPCRDGKARPVEPGTFPLAHGAPARVGRLRAYGNAIVPQVAAAFIRASADVIA